MKSGRPNTLEVSFPSRSGKAKAGCKVNAIDKLLARKFLQALGDPPIRVVLWDGIAVTNGDAANPVGMVIHDRLTLWRLLLYPRLYFGDDYSTGRIDIEGGMVAFMETIYRAMAQADKGRFKTTPRAYRKNQPGRNTLAGARRNIHYHYDIGNDFYKLWLDDEMLYTCAYFPEPGCSLEDAQIAKMDLVCRKLCLKPGQLVVEAGCGWGALARHMVKHYGVKVRAYNISHEQICYARKRAVAEGLEGRIEYVEDDYRSISGKFDAFVSVGMLEHVGPDHYRELGKVIDDCLKEQGLGLIHTIGQNVAKPMSPWFLKRVFPGSYPPTLREIMEIFEPRGFTVLDVENLRLHYSRTLEFWLERFENNTERISEMFDDYLIRTWRLYLSGSIANFNRGALQLFQVVFSRYDNNRIPMTRSHLIVPPERSDGYL
jgi:cyclopropane-fatty-acyl-phospholipid synthase